MVSGYPHEVLEHLSVLGQLLIFLLQSLATLLLAFSVLDDDVICTVIVDASSALLPAIL